MPDASGGSDPTRTKSGAAAQIAKEKTEEHWRRLNDENDNEFHAGENIRANIAHTKRFEGLNYDAVWRSPYFICYSSAERLSELDLLEIEDPKERRAKRSELRERRKSFRALTEDKADLLTGLYKEWMRLFAERLDLKELMAPYGGRPDYPPNVRTFRLGRPLTMWIFDTQESFQKFNKDIDLELEDFVAGYFASGKKDGNDGWIYLYDDSERNRIFDINKTLHEGVHQLQYWFTRQRNQWSHPTPSQNFFKEGLAEWLGAAQLQKDGSLKFVGVNLTRLRAMQGLARQLKDQNREYPIFPLNFVTTVNRYFQAEQYAAEKWELGDGIGIFYQQAWAFTYFANTFDGGRYKDNYMQLFNLILHMEGGPKLQQSFKVAFKIRGEDDWEELNDEYEEFVKGLLKEDLSKHMYKPPSIQRK